MVTSGQIDYMSRVLPKEDDTQNSSNTKEQLDLMQTGLAFLLLGCCFGLALLILVAEMAVGNRKLVSTMLE